MDIQLFPERNKIPKVAYAYTDNGIELPVLDITHPLFISSIDESALDTLGEKAVIKIKSFSKRAQFYKKFLGKRSFIIRGFFLKDPDDIYLNGMSTLILKLGPGFIGNGLKQFLDRRESKGFIGMSLRMRLRDLCRIQADALMPKLLKSPQRNLCFINIAGGSASDSINTLLLILRENPALLKNRQIEINVLDIDTFGPHFADRCVQALKEKGAPFTGLDITFRHILYNWNNTAKLVDLLRERKGWIQICASEGGLFEYGLDEEIIDNLASLYKYSEDDMILASDIMLDSQDVHPAIPAMVDATGLKVRLIGKSGLAKILENTEWKPDRFMEGNPIYIIFTLTKK